MFSWPCSFESVHQRATESRPRSESGTRAAASRCRSRRRDRAAGEHQEDRSAPAASSANRPASRPAPITMNSALRMLLPADHARALRAAPSAAGSACTAARCRSRRTAPCRTGRTGCDRRAAGEKRRDVERRGRARCGAPTKYRSSVHSGHADRAERHQAELEVLAGDALARAASRARCPRRTRRGRASRPARAACSVSRA